MTIAAHTLGCKLNYAETSDLLRRLSEEGHSIVEWGNVADLYIINTCTVTAVAEKKCRNAIRQAHRQNPDAQIVVMGCFAQVAAKEIESIPGVTLVLGNDRKAMLPQLLAGNVLSLPLTPSHSLSLPFQPSTPPETVPGPSSRYRTAATISAPTAPSPTPAAAPAPPPSKRPFAWPAASPTPAPKRWC